MRRLRSFDSSASDGLRSIAKNVAILLNHSEVLHGMGGLLENHLINGGRR